MIKILFTKLYSNKYNENRKNRIKLFFCFEWFMLQLYMFVLIYSVCLYVCFVFCLFAIYSSIFMLLLLFCFFSLIFEICFCSRCCCHFNLIMHVPVKNSMIETICIFNAWIRRILVMQTTKWIISHCLIQRNRDLKL